MKLNPQLLRLNRNLIACCVISALISAFVAQMLSGEENYLNTTITIVAGYTVFFGFFGCLFYLDNKKRYQAMKPKTHQKGADQASLILWDRRDRLSWNKVVPDVLFSGNRDRAICRITGF